MKKLAVGLALLSVTLLSACGGDESDDSTTVGTGSSSAPDDETSAEPTEDSGDGGASTVLTAVVGSEDDPDAFVIMLMDDSGAMVSTLPAGDYTIEVSDLSSIHNFHLTGGDVDETTTVDEITDTTWDVTLEPGDYSYNCDPHPNMTGAFTVT